MNWKRNNKILAVCLACIAAPLAHAAVVCVDSPAALAAALQTASANAEDDEIRVRIGHYLAPPGGWTADVRNGDHSLFVLGGFDDALCEQRLFDASLTVLDGGGRSRVLTIDSSQSFGNPRPEEHIVVSGFTFLDGFAEGIGGLKISDPGPIYGGNIRVEGNVFLDNVGTPDIFGEARGALLAATDGPDFDGGGTGLIVRNNVFARNQAPNAPAAFLFSNNRIVVSNNTFVDNQATDGALAARATVESFTLTQIEYDNNNFWFNNPDELAQTFDVRLNARTVLRHNNIQSSAGTAAVDVATMRLPPRLEDVSAGDFALRADSPLIDAGLNILPQGLGAWDVAGNARRAGAAVDIGAHEFTETVEDELFANGFEIPL